jgi:hypothetical protein
MEQQELREWTNQKHGIEIKAVLAEDVPYEATAGVGTEVADLWILFISIISNDYWVAYGIVDSLDGEPEESLASQNITELKKISIVLGDRWRKIDGEPVQHSQRHRLLANDSKVVNDIIMEMSFSELLERRQMVEWEVIQRRWSQFPMILSLN